jgi:hypothetical protein
MIKLFIVVTTLSLGLVGCGILKPVTLSASVAAVASSSSAPKVNYPAPDISQSVNPEVPLSSNAYSVQNEYQLKPEIKTFGDRVWLQRYHTSIEDLRRDTVKVEVNKNLNNSISGIISSASPKEASRITNTVISRNHEETLSVVVSSKLTQTELIESLKDYQKSLQATNPSVDSGALETYRWTHFKFISAKIDCPTFLICGSDINPQSIDNEPMKWSWRVNAAQWDATRVGSIAVKFYGYQSLSDKYPEEIVTLPPIKISVTVKCDIDWYIKFFNKLGELFTSIKGALVPLAALVGLVFGWLAWKR